MEMRFNVPGKKRKEMAQVIGRWLGCEIKYTGAPTFAYEIGNLTIDRNGILRFDGNENNEVLERLLEHLYDEGFESDISAEPELKSIRMPLTDFSESNIENLRKLISNKSELLKIAFETDNVDIVVDEGYMYFDWFKGDSNLEEMQAYDTFICRLCDMAKNQNRVNTSEKEVENEKYAFRCFLLRLGFIGDEYKQMRKILLRNFKGSSAFKNRTQKVKSEVTENA